MRLTYLGHACILVEVGGLNILMDPWLCGSAWQHAWWHVPPLQTSIHKLPRIDYIMISHIHDDHFHVPTLKQLPKTATAIIPYVLDPWMRETLQALGFSQVLELEHERPVRLQEGLLVKNFHFGRIDSAYWLSHESGSLLNLNDCPTSNRWVRTWLKNHPRPSIALSAFGYSSAYPVCYEIEGADMPKVIQECRQRVLKQFATNMALLDPQYAVPFAGQYGFLSLDQLWMNSHLPTPLDAAAALKAEECKVSCAVLNPGDQLSLEKGPTPGGSTFDWKRRDEEVKALALRRSEEVRQALEGEPEAPPHFFEQFCRFFEERIRKNRTMRKRVRVPIAFVLDGNQERWVVDCSRTSNGVTRRKGPSAPIEIHIPSTLLFAAVSGQIHWEIPYGSNRLKICLPEQLLSQEWDFWRMLFNFPQGIVRDRLRFLTPRGLRIVWRRRGEMLRLLVGHLMAAESSQREPYRDREI